MSLDNSLFKKNTQEGKIAEQEKRKSAFLNPNFKELKEQLVIHTHIHLYL